MSKTEYGVPVPRADQWFCERGDFWGTISQLCLCAKCGKNEIKRYDEPRHFRGIFTPYLHTICDDCFDSLPEGEAAPADRNPEGGNEVPSRSDESAVPKAGAL
jgi:hypothetical protein